MIAKEADAAALACDEACRAALPRDTQRAAHAHTSTGSDCAVGSALCEGIHNTAAPGGVHCAGASRNAGRPGTLPLGGVARHTHIVLAGVDPGWGGGGRHVPVAAETATLAMTDVIGGS
eukprot:CAMPEP_0185556288 /NCGR_PEP_ID=MMETSP1381-20130426/46772_1 /TAXON_ID=298111 /ORGANISM="Pavlova sp., Strain CCMP459" /LENGTH=118 /DNA_ID=CAMNT_0028169661 /DNA_START=41 /DNA_END=394 /DNA_ORIENTATION=-